MIIPTLTWRAIGLAVAVGIAIGTTATALLYGANLNSLGRGGEARIAEGFAQGSITGDDLLRGDTRIGANQFNDCLIIGMALQQSAPRTKLAISPTVPTGGMSCAGLARSQPRIYYHNYLHGQVTLLRYLLPALSIDHIRFLYKLVLQLLLLVGIAVAMFRLSKRDADWQKNAFVLIVLICLGRAFGLETFGQSLGHGPSDIVLVGYVVVASFAADVSERAAVVSAAVFGALTMVFELLTGGLPLGLAVIVGLLSFSDVRALVLSATAYLVAACTVFAAKIAAVAYVFGNIEYLGGIVLRTVGNTPSFMGDRSFGQAIIGSMDALMPGLPALANGILILAIVFGAYGLWRNPSRQAKIVALSSVPIFGWLAVFHQHTIIHAWFMDRMLTWVIASGFALFLFGLNTTVAADVAVRRSGATKDDLAVEHDGT